MKTDNEPLVVQNAFARYQSSAVNSPLVPPGYKLIEVGVIPEDWRVETVGQLAEVGRGRVISHREIARSVSPAYPVYSSQTSNEGVMGYLDTYDFEGEYVTWTTDGANAGTVFYRNGRFNCTNVCGTIKLKKDNAFFVSKTLARIAPRYVSRNLGNPKLMNDVAKQIPIALPSTPAEQRAIAATLSDVDVLLIKLDQLIAKKRGLKQAAMQQLLIGGTRLPGFSGAWAVKRLGDVIELIPTGIYGEEKRRHGTVPCRVVTTAHIDENDTWNGKEMAWRYFSLDQIRRYSPLDGDLIVVKSSGSAEKIQSGKIGFVDAEMAGTFLFSNFLMLLRPTCIMPRFLYFYLCLYNVKKLLPMLVEASTYPNIRIDEYLNLNIPTPQKDEQTAIAVVLSDMDAEIAALEARRNKTRSLKQGMMQELLTGRIRLV